MTDQPKYPELTVDLDLDGLGGDNIYAIVGRVRLGLKRMGCREDVEPFTQEVTATKSYNDAIAVVRRWVSTTGR